MCLHFSVLGDFDAVNFRDATTEDALENNTVIFEFEFEFNPLNNLDAYLGYGLSLAWSQVNCPTSGVVVADNCRNYKQSNIKLERVAQTGTYRLHVPLLFLGEGHLLVNFTINIICLKNFYRYFQCTCYDWRFRVISDSLEISAKRG